MMRTLVALLISPLAAAVALLVIAPGLMWLGLGNGPRERFWSTLPLIVIVGTGMSYVVTLVLGTLVHVTFRVRDREALRDYALAGALLGAAVPLVLLLLDGFNARAEDTLALTILGAAAGAATSTAFWAVAVKPRASSAVR